ncbi:MAG: hypothetical protein AABX51_03880 [Nanoarchaeota archaeon]
MKHKNSGKDNMDPMGFVWPILTSLLGLLMVLLVIFVLWLFNSFIPTTLIGKIIDFIYANIGLIFVMSVAFGYGSHLAKFQAPISSISPLVSAIGGVFLVFFIISILQTLIPNNFELAPLLFLVKDNLLLIFAVLMAAGYATYFLKLARAD